MCGIAGIVDLSGAMSPAELKATVRVMARTMPHRGPDDEGVFVDPDGRCALSHRRLSIIDVSSAGHQPMEGPGGRSWITFNGEIYNFQELRAELESAGREFHTRTDTEVLLHAFEQYGDGMYAKLDGMYGFGIYDLTSRALTLARDPFGKKPLYYARGDGWFAFASELHALTAVPGFDATIDADRIAEYLSFQYIGAPRTIYRSAAKLPPGQFLRLGPDGAAHTEAHFRFDPRGDRDPSTSTEELTDELEEILLRNTKRRMISDVPLGAFLSGGVDSATVVALMAKGLHSL